MASKKNEWIASSPRDREGYKDIDSHSVRALLASRTLLVKIKRDLENHVRGLLKNLGLVIGRAKFNVFAVRAEELIEGRPERVGDEIFILIPIRRVDLAAILASVPAERWYGRESDGRNNRKRDLHPHDFPALSMDFARASSGNTSSIA